HREARVVPLCKLPQHDDAVLRSLGFLGLPSSLFAFALSLLLGASNLVVLHPRHLDLLDETDENALQLRFDGPARTVGPLGQQLAARPRLQMKLQHAGWPPDLSDRTAVAGLSVPLKSFTYPNPMQLAK